MTNENKKSELEAMFAFCDKVFVRAKETKMVVPLELSGLNLKDVEKISEYVKGKNLSDEYIVMELKGTTSYEAHIKYKKVK